MKPTDKARSIRQTTIAGATRVRDRLRITWGGMVALAVAIVATGAAGLVLVAVSQDVIAGDGIELRDASTLQTVVSHRTPGLISLARLLTQVGSISVVIPLAVVAALFLWARGARLVVAVAPVISLLLAGLCASVGKQLVGRSRPPQALRLLTETEPSFPSGHSTDSAAFFIALALIVAVVMLRRPIVRLLTIACAALLVFGVGVSRLVLGVHWPTDVIVGWALGLAIALVVTTAALLVSLQAPAEPYNGTRRLQRLWFQLCRLAAVGRTMHNATT